MKLLFPILIIFSSSAYGQVSQNRNPYEHITIFEQFKEEDLPEGLYTIDSLLLSITDTLPVYTSDEYNWWRNIQLVTYFYDSTGTIKKIYFRNGREGRYYFYFDNNYLKKVRHSKSYPQAHLKYYISAEENKFSISEIDQKMVGDSNEKDKYETLKLARKFFERFQLLYNRK